ncbi:hypothetical protein DNC80_15480 [Flavobacterium sp. SOK18b]|uniref:hypothetical protein n=1 Tax=Flavobacterium sp. SOK18b TaxID=797900 RepID=UPI0015F87854|nr:hypothetical protein [Flavobacterium sp. SOK18b]MBB1195066.1 hypothetical protein [Flavobacterium sp. SOK18b]
MKKLITSCILAIGMIVSAQTNQVITKPLQLNSVASGSSTDKHLVIGENKVVKKVTDNSVKSVNGITPINGNVTIRLANSNTPNLRQILDQGFQAESNFVISNANRSFRIEHDHIQINSSNGIFMMGDLTQHGNRNLFGDTKQNGAFKLRSGAFHIFSPENNSEYGDATFSYDNFLGLSINSNSKIRINAPSGGVEIFAGNKLKLTGISEYADDSAAGAAGLERYNVYVTPTGVLMMKL